MIRSLLFYAFIFFCNATLSAQYEKYEALWFEARIQWADRFETLEPVNDKLAVVRRAGQYGIVDRSGDLIVPLRYRQRYANNPVLQNGDCFAWYAADGRIREICGYDQVFIWSENRWQVGRNGLLGLMDSTQHLVVPVAFTALHPKGDKIFAADSTGLFGLIDRTGQWIFRPAYRRLASAPHGYLLGHNSPVGCVLLDSLGHPLTGFDFRNIVPLCDGTFWATRADDFPADPYLSNGQPSEFRHYDAQGRLLPDSACQSVESPPDGRMLRIMCNGRREFWDGCGNPTLPGFSWEAPAYDTDLFDWRRTRQTQFPADMVSLAKNGRFGLYLPLHNRIIPAQYRQVYATTERIAACRAEGGTDWYDLRGEPVTTTADSVIGIAPPGHPFPDRFLTIRKTGECGVLDARGNPVIPARYHHLRPVESGCYVYGNHLNRPDHLLGPDGREIPVPDGCQFESVCGNYFLFSRGPNRGLADLAGRIRLKPEYRWLLPLDNFHFIYQQGSLYGVVDATGRQLLPPEYSHISLREGYFLLQKDGRHGIADQDGKLIVPFDYQEQVGLGGNILLLKGKHAWRFDPAAGTLTDTGWEWGDHSGAVRRNGRWGLADEKLRLLLPFEYDTVFQRESHVIARKQGQDYLFTWVKSRLEPIAASRLIRNLYWATWLERGGKQGLRYASGDSLPAIYDDIAIDYVRQGVLALLRDGRCTVPGPEGEPPLYEFPADSLRSFYIDGWLQYWRRGEAWLLNTRNGARRPLELMLPEGGEQLLVAWDRTPGMNRIFRVRSQGRERHALLDNGLKDVIPDGLVFQPEHYVLGADSQLLFRVTRNGREGLWNVEKRELVFPYEFDEMEAIRLNTGRDTSFLVSSGLARQILLPTDVVRLHRNGKYGLGRISDGTLLLPCKYKAIGTVTDKCGLLELYKSTDYSLYRLSDGKILPPEYKTSLQDCNPK